MRPSTHEILRRTGNSGRIPVTADSAAGCTRSATVDGRARELCRPAWHGAFVAQFQYGLSPDSKCPFDAAWDRNHVYRDPDREFERHRGSDLGAGWAALALRDRLRDLSN